jgi:hypothetical protein
MTPAQIAEHEQCMALLRRADRHPDFLNTARRLAREPGRKDGSDLRGVL